ncbi:hypothetical protein KR018_007021 [Drosophila ironensis]|nr:hypothetical protein KR018_007021 [Drosophila ironensis]
MQWLEVELDGGRTSTFAERLFPGVARKSAEFLGGYMHGGRLAWVTCQYANNATIRVSQTTSGHCASSYSFWHANQHGFEDINCSISCVTELFPGRPDHPAVLAICLERWSNLYDLPQQCPNATTQVIIWSATHGQVLARFDLEGVYCTAMAFLGPDLLRGTPLQRFDGCLAVASREGIIVLIDLNLEHMIATKCMCIQQAHTAPPVKVSRQRCVGARRLIDGLLVKSRFEGAYLTIDIEVRMHVFNLMPIGAVPGFAAGVEGGGIIVYDLVDFHQVTMLRTAGSGATVQRMCCIYPPDDPKPCFYVCALYKSPLGMCMMLHVVNYKRSYLAPDSEDIRFKDFHSSSVKNHQTFDSTECTVFGCSTVDTFGFAGDSGTQLALLSWHSLPEGRNKLVLFDMNQWYKDELPNGLQPGEKPNYLAGYVLSGQPRGLALHLRANTIMHFVSLNRCDEHFYPNSLTFDCSMLTEAGSRYYAQDGVQNRFLNRLRWERATLFLHPKPCLDSIVQLRLLAQFSEYDPDDKETTKTAMYEEILSVALEHKCVALLNDCARSWMDGSFQCNMADPTEITLTTLTNWILRRAAQIKNRCSEICQGIFDYDGYSLDDRERREYQVLTVQTGELLRLQSYILEQGTRIMSSSVRAECQANEQALRTVHIYQRVLYWFVLQGLLPEGEAKPLQPEQQPLARLRRDYDARRAKGMRLYIDELGKQAFMTESYPPASLQVVLHLMLNPNTLVRYKYEVVLYLLHDIGSPKLLQRFETTFEVEQQVCTSVLSFWHLDRGEDEKSVRELMSGLRSVTHYEGWQMKLLVENLLDRDAVKGAKQVFNTPPGSLSSDLRLRILLANNNIPQAFDLAREYTEGNGKTLMEQFFRYCIDNNRFKVLSELCLRENEERMVYQMLRDCGSRQADCVQLILLLQKSKYIDAVGLMDEVAEKQQQQQRRDDSHSIISAYRSTMAPFTQELAGTYFTIRGKLDCMNKPPSLSADYPGPLSSQLAKENAGGTLGGIFHSSALSTHWATRFDLSCPPTSPPTSSGRVTNRAQNIPFLRNAQNGLMEPPRRRMVRAVPHQVAEKRLREGDEDMPPAQRADTYMDARPKRRRLAEQIGDEVHEHLRAVLAQRKAAKKTEEKAAEQPRNENRIERLLQTPDFLQDQPRERQVSVSPRPTILKRRTTLSAAAPALAAKPIGPTSTAVAERRRFHFVPANPLKLERLKLDSKASSRASKDQQAAGEEAVADEQEQVEEEEEEETDEIIMEIESSALAQDALESGEEEEEEEQFLSPLASANVSLAEPRESPRSSGPPPGPQPRTPLVHAASAVGTGAGAGTGIGDGDVASSESSGFASFGTVRTAQTASHLQSHSQFVPTICSSKMYETRSQLHGVSSIITSTAKISERTTICGDMETTDLIPQSTASLAATPSEWALPLSQSESQSHGQTQGLRMLDTTLEMSTYDITSMEVLEPHQEDQEVEMMDAEELVEKEQQPEEAEEQEEVEKEQAETEDQSKEGVPFEEEQQHSEEEEEQKFEEEQQHSEEKEEQKFEEEQQHFEEEKQTDKKEQQANEEKLQLEEQQHSEKEEVLQNEEKEQQAEDEVPQLVEAEPEPEAEGEYQMSYLTSPAAPAEGGAYSAYSLSSEDISELSSIPDPTRPTLADIENPMYATVESTGSITTSRSVTHTPTSFLPSDTNVSQNSSPRAPHGASGEGSLFRANSLETVDDLDTTKGSLEEEEDDDYEDDCVIALDGTEVREFVARPEQSAACSSAELFAFKDDRQEEAAPGPCPSLSIGATANSDSVVVLDSDEDNSHEAAQPMEVDPVEEDSDKDVSHEAAQPIELVEEDSNKAVSHEASQPIDLVEDDSDKAVSHEPAPPMVEEPVREDSDKAVSHEAAQPIELVEEDSNKAVSHEASQPIELVEDDSDKAVSHEAAQSMEEPVEEESDLDVSHEAAQPMGEPVEVESDLDVSHEAAQPMGEPVEVGSDLDVSHEAVQAIEPVEEEDSNENVSFEAAQSMEEPVEEESDLDVSHEAAQPMEEPVEVESDLDVSHEAAQPIEPMEEEGSNEDVSLEAAQSMEEPVEVEDSDHEAAQPIEPVEVEDSDKDVSYEAEQPMEPVEVEDSDKDVSHEAEQPLEKALEEDAASAAEEPLSSDESVATVAFSERVAADTSPKLDVILEVESSAEEDDVKPEPKPKTKGKAKTKTKAVSKTKTKTKGATKAKAKKKRPSPLLPVEDSDDSLTLQMSEDEEVATASRTPRLRRGGAFASRERLGSETPPLGPVTGRMRLRSRDINTPPVSTPRAGRYVLAPIDEQDFMDNTPVTRARSRAGSVAADAVTPSSSARNWRSKRASSVMVEQAPTPPTSRPKRGISEPPTSMVITPGRALRSRSRKPSEMSETASNEDRDVQDRSNEDLPRLRRTPRRLGSQLIEAADEVASTSTGRSTRTTRSTRSVAVKKGGRTSRATSQETSGPSAPSDTASETSVPPKKRGRPKK